MSTAALRAPTTPISRRGFEAHSRSRRPHDWHARCVRSREVWQLRFGDSSFTLD